MQSICDRAKETLMFDYDRDIMQPPEEREELDPSQYIYVGCGQYRYVGDEV